MSHTRSTREFPRMWTIVLTAISLRQRLPWLTKSLRRILIPCQLRRRRQQCNRWMVREIVGYLGGIKFEVSRVNGLRDVVEAADAVEGSVGVIADNGPIGPIADLQGCRSGTATITARLPLGQQRAVRCRHDDLHRLQRHVHQGLHGIGVSVRPARKSGVPRRGQPSRGCERPFTTAHWA